MARPPLPIGSWGEISTWVVQTDDEDKPTKYKSQARYRDHDGHVRPVSAYGKNKTAARQSLLKKLQDRTKTGPGGDLTAIHKINHLLDLWVTKFKEQIADGTRSPTSLDTYLRAIKNHVRPALGELRIGEVNTPRVDTVISKIKKNTGPPTAKTCRAIISGMMQLAVRYGAITVNPLPLSGWCAATTPHRCARGRDPCSTASMPRPRRSTLTRPIQAQSSLSHCSTVRFSLRACSIGTTSPTGRSVSTMPPE